MKKFLIILPLIFLAGCEFRYRYECQDPANWGKESCNNDLCKAEGSCTADVLGFKPGSSAQPMSADMPPENIDSAQPEISNQATECESPAPKIIYRDREVMTNLEAEKQYKEDVSEQLVAEKTERPLTMDTVVETTSHNLATKLFK